MALRVAEIRTVKVEGISVRGTIIKVVPPISNASGAEDGTINVRIRADGMISVREKED